MTEPPTEAEMNEARIREGDLSTDAVLGVEERMTDGERRKFLDRMTGRRNPHLSGAHVSDILDMLWESDAYLGILEPFHEGNEALWESCTRLQRRSLSYAAIAAVVLLELEDAAGDPPPEMLPLAKRLAGVSDAPT